MAPRCEAGAYWNERGRVTYVCPNEAVYQVLMNGEDLLLVWCMKHMQENVVDFLTRNPEVRVERWREEE